MKDLWKLNILSILASLPFLVAALLVRPEAWPVESAATPVVTPEGPSPFTTSTDLLRSPSAAASSPYLEACRLDCTMGGQVCVRHDFNLIGVEYRRGSVNSVANVAGNGYEWTFNGADAYLAEGAELVLTWEMKREIRGTACAEAIWKGAELGNMNPWYTQIRFIHPYQYFNGDVLIDQNNARIKKRIPLGNLQPSNYGLGYRLQFGIVYQESKTCMTYQDPLDQMITFSAPPGRDSPPPEDDDTRRREPEPLRWSTPISAENLGEQPDPEITAKSLADIVNSVVEARPDDVVCSACHHGNTAFDYRPQVSQAQATPGQITPSTSITKDGTRNAIYSWNQPGGIIAAFTNASPAKPQYLKTAFEKWAADGYLP